MITGDIYIDHVIFTTRENTISKDMRIHPRLILQKLPSNIECNVPEHSNKGANNLLSTSKIEDHPTMITNQSSSSTTLHCRPAQSIDPIIHTTRMFEGVSPIDLAKDLKISDSNSESEDPKAVSITTNSHSENPKVVSIRGVTEQSTLAERGEFHENSTPILRVDYSCNITTYRTGYVF